MAHHVEFADNPYLAWGGHLIAEPLCIPGNRHVQPGDGFAVSAGAGQMNSLHLSLEEGMPLTEVLQKRLIIHIAGDFLIHHDMTDAAHEMNRRLVWSGHFRPKARLFKHFRDRFPKPGSPDVKHRLPAPLAKAQGANV
jgi:hypothetical protein